jgi:hypothetical protein
MLPRHEFIYGTAKTLNATKKWMLHAQLGAQLRAHGLLPCTHPRQRDVASAIAATYREVLASHGQHEADIVAERFVNCRGRHSWEE